MLALCFPVLLAPFLQDATPPDWPSFRGPNGSGVTSATGLPDVLDVDENAVWRVELPPGYSSPIVVGERVVCTGVRDGACVTLCFDALTGEPLWTVEAPEPRHEWEEQYNTPASPTPASDGRRLFVLFPTYGMVAYDLEGEELWRRPMERFDLPHGMSSSPLHVQGPRQPMVLLQCDQSSGSHLLALDARTGETVWDAPRPGITHSYTSPAASAGVVVANGAFRTVAYSLADGQPLWWFDGMGWDTSILPLLDGGLAIVGSNGPPLSELGVADLSGTWEEALAAKDQDDDGKLTAAEWEDPNIERLWYYFDLDGDGAMAAAEHAHALRRQATKRRMLAIELGGEGDVTDSHLRWSYEDRRGLPGVSSPLVVDGVLFLVKDGGIVTTLRAADGTVLKQERAGGQGEAMASPVAADGKVYLASTGGVLTVLSAKGEWEVLGQSDLDEEVWASPAIACGGVYVRSLDALYCFRDDE